MSIGAQARARARTGRAPAARSRGSGAGTAHGRAASSSSAPERACRGGPASWRSSRNSQMSQVACGDGPRVVVVEVEHLRVLGLERVGARRRGADDPVARAGRSRRGPRVLRRRPPAGAGVQAVADHRQAAADLLRDDRLEAVPAQDVDRGVGDVRLVVVRGAAVEVDDGPIRAGGAPGRRRRSRRPGASSRDRNVRRRTSAAAPGGGCRPSTRSADRTRPLRERRSWRAAQSATPSRADEVGLAEAASRGTAGRWPARSRARARLFISAIFTSGRAGGRAQAAAGAVVDRVGRATRAGC